ncbi:hypothetical protein B0H14DRAFT_3439229 [Mycena olivaceomarginata]|nr:hypothetical protein B0H14DRAFT_3439229 [Mycena olivaceomarginata]
MGSEKPVRKATTTAKAKQAAAIAAAESKDDEDASSVPRKRGRPPKTKAAPPPKEPVVHSDADDADEIDVEELQGSENMVQKGGATGKCIPRLLITGLVHGLNFLLDPSS